MNDEQHSLVSQAFTYPDGTPLSSELNEALQGFLYQYKRLPSVILCEAWRAPSTLTAARFPHIATVIDDVFVSITVYPVAYALPSRYVFLDDPGTRER